MLNAIIGAESGLAAAGRAISLDDAVVKTMERNPALVAFGYQIEAQDGREMQAGLAPNPELSFTVENTLGTGEFSGSDNAEATLSIVWILERGVRQRRLDMARAGGRYSL